MKAPSTPSSRCESAAATIARPDLTFAIADHYVPTRARAQPIANPEIARMVDQLGANAAAHGIVHFGLDDPRQGIVHVAVPEQGLTLPGLLIVCGDSHTSTHGAFGAYAFGIGASEVAHVLMTQTIWQKKPKRMRMRVDGRRCRASRAKDIALTIIARIGADGAQGHAIEYAGSAMRALSMEGRMTLCNLSIEAGGAHRPRGAGCDDLRLSEGPPVRAEGRDASSAPWRIGAKLASDADASFDREVTLDARRDRADRHLGHQPGACVADRRQRARPGHARRSGARRRDRASARLYGPRAGQEAQRDRGRPGLHRLLHQRPHRGSARRRCRARRAGAPRCRASSRPDRSAVKRQAEEEGLDRIFREAGLEWADSGCSMCVGINGDLVPPGERCASTTNRNFKGRQGPRRAHASDVAGHGRRPPRSTGHLTDARSS